MPRKINVYYLGKVYFIFRCKVVYKYQDKDDIKLRSIWMVLSLSFFLNVKFMILLRNTWKIQNNVIYLQRAMIGTRV